MSHCRIRKCRGRLSRTGLYYSRKENVWTSNLKCIKCDSTYRIKFSNDPKNKPIEEQKELVIEPGLKKYTKRTRRKDPYSRSLFSKEITQSIKNTILAILKEYKKSVSSTLIAYELSRRLHPAIGARFYERSMLNYNSKLEKNSQLKVIKGFQRIVASWLGKLRLEGSVSSVKKGKNTTYKFRKK